MLRFRHMLLALAALALFLSSGPVHATVFVTDNQVKPVAYGPGASDDQISYTCTSDNSSPSAAYRIWYPGYTPTGSEDKSADGHYNDFTDSNAISNDGLPHGFEVNPENWTQRITTLQSPMLRLPVRPRKGFSCPEYGVTSHRLSKPTSHSTPCAATKVKLPCAANTISVPI